MSKETRMGMNRTGIDMSPKDSKALLQGSERSMPTSEGDEQAIATIRKEYIAESDPLGSVPPPGTVKGAMKSGAQMLTGNRPQVLIDKLGERLAFERGGTRLYEALIAKCEARDEVRDIIDMGRLNEIHRQEMRHFELVRRTMEEMGCDPTAQTPCADAVGVATLGLVQVLTDPRTTVSQSMNAILTAELADNAGWDLLVVLMRETGQDEKMVEEFEAARLEERTHVESVMSWMLELTRAESSIMATA